MNATVTRLAALRGTSRSAVIREFLIETQPVLERVANLLDLAARTDKGALKQWADTLGAAQAEIEQDATAALAAMDTAQRTLELARPGRPVVTAGRTRRPPGRPPAASRKGKRRG